jgi:hypothetical protein
MSKLQTYGRPVLLKFAKTMLVFKTMVSSSLCFHDVKQLITCTYKALGIIKKFLCLKFHVRATLKEFFKNPSTF